RVSTIDPQEELFRGLWLPDLAEKWESLSPTVIEFTLRKGVKFHNKPPVNGREVTAEDAKYSIERFRSRSAFRARFDVVQAIDVVNRYTLRVTLKEPFAPFLKATRPADVGPRIVVAWFWTAQTSSNSALYSTLMPRRTLWLAGQPFSCTPSARSASARLPLGILHV